MAVPVAPLSSKQVSQLLLWHQLKPYFYPHRQMAYRRATGMSSLPVSKVYSLSEDLMGLAKQTQSTDIECQRTGIMAAFSSFQQFEE